MKCPICGEVELVYDVRDISYTYKDNSTIVSQIKGKFCSACDEIILTKEEAARLNQTILNFNKKLMVDSVTKQE